METSITETTGEDGRIISEIPSSAYIISCSCPASVVWPFLSGGQVYGFFLYVSGASGLEPVKNTEKTVKILYRN